MKLPVSKGEHQAQEAFGTTRRALTFYNKQMLHYLNPLMREFIARQEMVFIATADAHGECACSLRAGLPGFVHVLDDKTLAYPESYAHRGWTSTQCVRRVSHTSELTGECCAQEP